jgi:UDPglucose 6-dehydrogenase
MRGVIDINEQQHERMIQKITRAVGRFEHDRLTGVTIGALGLTFKAGTDDLRESPSVRILDELVDKGARVRAYDPTTVGALDPHRSHRLERFHLATDPADAATGADAIVVLTEWPEFQDVDLRLLTSVMRKPAMVDCRNLFHPAAVREAGMSYEGVGRR